MADKIARDRRDYAHRNCAAEHISPWLVEFRWFDRAVAAVRSGTWKAQSPIVLDDDAEGHVLYTVDDSGVAHVNIDGPIMKGDSKFGGASSLRLRRAMRAAGADKDVKGVLMAIDSPGGTVAGTEEAGNEIKRLTATKPVFAHGEDLVASAAYWLAAQATRLSTTPSTETGSIGVVAVVEDTSGAAEAEGVKVHKITNTGGEAYKGAFADGTEVTAEQLAYLKESVDQVFDRFLTAVARSPRNLLKDDVRKVADGRTYIASEALEANLIDAVESYDEARSALLREIRARESDRKRRAANMQRRAKIIELGG